MTEAWSALREECLSCQRCGLAETRKNVVFGDGNPEAELLFIGEGPGANEDAQGLPFVDRTMVYITNIVKCRPPQNRDPLNVEQEACIEYLRRQTAMIQPKIIVCLGRIAAMQIIKPDFKITKEHGQWFDKAGIRMTALYHPAALLRDPSRRPETFDDLKNIQAEIRRICTRTYPGQTEANG